MSFFNLNLIFCVTILVSTIRGDGGRDSGTLAPPSVTVPAVVIPEVQPTNAIGTVPPVTPKPPPIEGCALPPNPQQESEKIVGYRFGMLTNYVI